jgi:dTDP-4-amino-4,6-dideoxygalactose transaminase
MVDLKGQYEKIKETVSTSMQSVLDTTSYINGPLVHQFQKNLEHYLGVKHVIPCANGTDALQIAMMGLGLKPGDEVITADFTFAATVEVIALLNLTPVLVDVNSDDFNINIDAIKKAITPKTKAIVPVHLFGQCADMESIMEIAKEHNLFVIEDNAQGIGANYTFKNGTKVKSGTIGHIGSTSFFPSKNLGAYGDGGAIFTNDDTLAHTIRGIVNHGMYERYHHDVVGVNSRLDSLQAAVLDAKLPHLDTYNSARRNAAKKI